jgi:peptide-methionine (S)-S-oxide reductase
MRQFLQYYPQAVDFMNSTAAARVNGYIGGYGTAAGYKADIDRLGLSAAAREELEELVRLRN